MCCSPKTSLTWRRLHYPRPLDAEQAVEAIRRLATDPRSPLVVLEARGSASGVRFLTGCEADAMPRVVKALGAVAVGLSTARVPAMTARRLSISNRQRPLATDAIDAVAPATLAALNACRDNEELVLQVVLGPRLSGLVVPSTARQPVPIARLLVGYPANNRDGRMDAEARTALVRKVCEPGFCATVRIGVAAATPARRQTLALGLLGALRRLQAPGAQIYLAGEKPERVDEEAAPWRWPLRLNVAEVAAIAALPVSDGKHGDELPGLPPLHPFPVAPLNVTRPSKNRVVVARATAPSIEPNTFLTRSNEALARHLHICGPTGTGKSVLLANLALQDITAGRGVVVIEPKGDLVNDVLARMPESRRGDVVVLDPTSASGVVGLNPLAGHGSPELKADAVLSVFVDLFGDALGPRTTDILHSCLLTLARQSDASLVQIPRLLTDVTFRQRVLSQPDTHGRLVTDDPALGPFWAWFDGLSDAERASVIAPLMNKLRAVLLRPSIRSVLGQVEPKFDVREVFFPGRQNDGERARPKILLVPLPVATLGSEGPALLGSLVVSQLWDAARERTAVDPKYRAPVAVYLDEAQSFMRLPTDLSDALATSRGLGVGWTLAHQYLSQLPPAMRAAVLANCRSRVVFQTTRDDGKVFASETSGDLEVEDFVRLPAFNVYASLFDRGSVQPYVSGVTVPLGEPTADPDVLRAASAERYGRPVSEVEAEFAGTSGGTLSADLLPPTSSETAADASASGGRRRRTASGRSSGRVTSGGAKTVSDCAEAAEMSAETSSDDDVHLPPTGARP